MAFSRAAPATTPSEPSPSPPRRWRIFTRNLPKSASGLYNRRGEGWGRGLRTKTWPFPEPPRQRHPLNPPPHLHAGGASSPEISLKARQACTTVGGRDGEGACAPKHSLFQSRPGGAGCLLSTCRCLLPLNFHPSECCFSQHHSPLRFTFPHLTRSRTMVFLPPQKVRLWDSGGSPV